MTKHAGAELSQAQDQLSKSSVSPKLRLGVDFVFPLSQQQQQELPHQNLNEGEVLEV